MARPKKLDDSQVKLVVELLAPYQEKLGRCISYLERKNKRLLKELLKVRSKRKQATK